MRRRRRQADGARLRCAALEVALALEDLQVVVDGRRGRETDGARDLAHRRRIAAGAQRGRDVVEDPDFRSASCLVTRASLLGHHTERTFDVKASGSPARGARIDAGRVTARNAGRLPAPVRRIAFRSGARGDGWPDGCTKVEERTERRSPVDRAMLSLLAFLPVASRAPDYARLSSELVRDERTPAAAQGAARRAPSAISSSAATSSRTTSRSSVASTISSSWSSPWTCSSRVSRGAARREARSSSASTASRSSATWPRSGA